MDEFNKRAYELLEKLKPDTEKKTSEPAKDIIGIPISARFSNVKNLKKILTDGHGNYDSAFIDVNGEMIGLDRAGYKILRELATDILEVKEIYRVCDSEYIEKKVFDWLIKTYREKKSSEDLMNFIYNEIDTDVKEFTFYFKIIACGIEAPFEIGLIRIGTISNENKKLELERFIKAGGTQEVFEDLIKDYINEPLAIAICKGVHSKAERLAMRETTLAMDVIKSLLIEESIYSYYQVPDADFNSNEMNFSEYLSRSNNENDYLNPTLFRDKGIPTVIDAKKVRVFKARGFEKLKAFISKKSDSESYSEGIRMITRLGDVSATWNLYEKIVKIISLFESTIIPDGSTKAKGLTLLKNNIIQSIYSSNSDRETLNEIANKMYKTRDKYLHNGLELSIDIDDLFLFQKLALDYLTDFITKSETHSTLQDIQRAYRTV